MSVDSHGRFGDEAYIRVVFETMQDGLVVIDEGGTVRVFNPACERMFGYAADEVIGNNVRLLMPDAESERHDGYLAHYARTGQRGIMGRQRELEGRRKDGTLFPLSLSVGEAMGEGGRNYIGVLHDLTDEVDLRRHASIDPLTGVLNRRDLLVRGGEDLARADRYGHPGTVLMMDIDHFKRINDTFGHAEGDEALRRFAAACEEVLRENDLFGRMGGEEFAIVLPETTVEGGRLLAERLRKRVAEIEISAEGKRLAMTVSIGVAAQRLGKDNIETLLSRADRALYRAKQQGRNRVVVGAAGAGGRPAANKSAD